MQERLVVLVVLYWQRVCCIGLILESRRFFENIAKFQLGSVLFEISFETESVCIETSGNSHKNFLKIRHFNSVGRSPGQSPFRFFILLIFWSFLSSFSTCTEELSATVEINPIFVLVVATELFCFCFNSH